LPLPERLFLSPASQQDLAASREFNPQLSGCVLFGDKAYAEIDTKATLQKCGIYLMTPYKRKRNEEETAVPTLFNRFVSGIRHQASGNR
jgi:hypothetical protein